MAIVRRSPHYKSGENWNNTLIFSSKQFHIALFPPLKWLTLPKALFFDKDNNQAVRFNANVILLINVLLDDSVVIIVNFSQTSIEYFLEPD